MEKEILHGKMYFTMPQAPSAAGGDVIMTNVDFEPHVIVDRELITGQNLRSDHGVGEVLVKALDKATARHRSGVAASA